MGTVGLSFGSPTSGAGFDVSTTVASIVSNLQNVETPWKTQLTTLQSQDTAISSLGALFSTLSTDLSQLTDMTGIMAQKLGSSSDTNVLTLTAATSTAVSGTHTVEVSNLAQTSSGYLSGIASATDELSGSITIQVGSGAAHTIKVPTTNTLAGLAAAINSSGVGVTASVLTDASGSRLSIVSGTSGANGNVTITKNSIADTTAKTLAYTSGGYNSSNQDTGTVGSIGNASDILTGSLQLTVGSTTYGISPDSGSGTLQDYADQINNHSYGVTATVVTSNGQSSLSLVSQNTGTAGAFTVGTPGLADATPGLGYNATVTGMDAELTVDGVNLTSSSNTVANLIPGVTFQLLAPSSQQTDGTLNPVQVVIANDNSGVESTVATFVSDYNSLISAINTQDGFDSSGAALPLFGSPTLSLLQQQLLNGLNAQNPNGALDAITDNTNTVLSGSISIQAGSGTAKTVVVGAVPSTGAAANTIYTGSGANYNTLDGLAAAINAANINLSYSETGSSATGSYDGGSLTPVANLQDALSGSITIKVGSGAAQTITLTAGQTLQDLANSIDDPTTGVSGVTASVVTNSNGVATLSLASVASGAGGALTVSSDIFDGIGATASTKTLNGQTTLALQSQTSGSAGALTIGSNIVATSDKLLSYTGMPGSTTENSAGTLTSVNAATDALSGSITIQVGSGTAQTVTVPDSPKNTLQDLADAINATPNIGVSATVGEDSDGLPNLLLESGTSGSDGTITATSSILDTTNPTSTTLSYTNTSDLTSLSSLGISVSSNYDGSLSYDATSLDSVLNADFSGAVGFFQSADGWGSNFATMLNSTGSSSSTGSLKLALTANSNTESTLNADISKEDSLISAQQKSLTAELTSANEILQEIPTQLSGVNELYSAITGYNQNNQ
jgi:flagellar hook-associated protein 2